MSSHSFHVMERQPRLLSAAMALAAVVVLSAVVPPASSFSLLPCTTKSPLASTSTLLPRSSRSSLAWDSSRSTCRQRTILGNALSNDEDEDDEDEDDYIDTESLGDWRNFRRSLTIDGEATANESINKPTRNTKTSTISKENEELLASQNEQLHQEFKSGVWAHETSTVSGILCYGVERSALFSRFSLYSLSYSPK